MQIDLNQLFSSPARTAVLEILAKAHAPLHLRALAEIARYNVSAIQNVLKELQKEKIVQSKTQSNKRMFSLNRDKEEAKLLTEIIATKEKLSTNKQERRLGELVEFALSLADDAFQLKEKKRPRLSSVE